MLPWAVIITTVQLVSGESGVHCDNYHPKFITCRTEDKICFLIQPYDEVSCACFDRDSYDSE